MTLRNNDCFTCGFLVYLWTALLCLGIAAGCGDNLQADPTEPFPRLQPCGDFLAAVRHVDAELEVPSMTPATLGVRIIVADDFLAFDGASSPVPGGQLAWRVWVYHWFDGDYLGAVGIAGDGMCRWYDPI